MIKRLERSTQPPAKPSVSEPTQPAVTTRTPLRFDSEFSTGRTRALRTHTASTNEVVPLQSSSGVASTTGPTPEEFSAISLELRDYAVGLSGSHDAAQIQALVMQEAIDTLLTRYPDMTTAELMDHAMAATTMVLVGPDQIGNLEKIDGSDPMVALMKQLPAEAFAGGDLATAHGTLRADFDDGTTNQAFHCFFFVAAGYVAGSDGGKQWLATMGNLKHEVADAGPSQEDYVASHMSIELGVLFSQMRDNAPGTGNRQYPASMPALLDATMSESHDSADAQYTIAGQQYDFSEVAAQHQAYVTDRANQVEGSFHVGMVNFFNGLRDLLGIRY